MANIKIAQLTNQTSISDNDLVIVESATSTNKMTVGKLKELLGIQAGGIEASGVGFIKFKDGKLICFGTGNGLATFAERFKVGTTPSVSITPAPNTVPMLYSPTYLDSVNVNVLQRYWDNAGKTFLEASQDYSYIAVGIWK